MGAVAEQVANQVSVVYVSSGVRRFQPEEILEILRTSRRNNEKRNITGMLLYKDGNFLQVLEGPEQAITQLLQTIETDPRHRGMIQLTKKPIEERQFANWSMAFKDLDRLSAEDAAAYSPFLKESLLDKEFRSKPDRCYQLLLRFKQSVR